LGQANPCTGSGTRLRNYLCTRTLGSDSGHGSTSDIN